MALPVPEWKRLGIIGPKAIDLAQKIRDTVGIKSKALGAKAFLANLKDEIALEDKVMMKSMPTNASSEVYGVFLRGTGGGHHGRPTAATLAAPSLPRDTVVGRDGWTVLHEAVATRDSITKIHELLKRPDLSIVNLPATDEQITPLHVAAFLGLSEIVRVLIAQLLTKNSRAAADAHGRTPLEWALRKGDKNVVETFLRGSLDRLKRQSVVDKECAVAALGAARMGSLEILSMLDHHALWSKHANQILAEGLKNNQVEVIRYMSQRGYGTTVGAEGAGGWSTLHTAAFAGADKTISYLVGNGSDVDPVLDTGLTPLAMAAAVGEIKAVTTLLKFKANVLAPESVCELTPLHWAAYGGHNDCLREMLKVLGEKNAALTNSTDSLMNSCPADTVASTCGLTPLHVACLGAKPETAKMLVEEYGCDKNASDSDGVSCGLLAAAVRSIKTINLLHDLHCNLHATTRAGTDMFQVAANSGAVDIIRFILKLGVNPNKPGAKGMRAMHVAAKAGGTHVCNVLLSQGADVTLADNFGNTAAHYAAHGHPDTLKHLIDAKADLLVKNKAGGTVFMEAAKGGYDRCVRLILPQLTVADCNTKDNDGHSALLLACRWGHVSCVRILFALVENCDIPDEAVYLACRYGHADVARLLMIIADANEYNINYNKISANGDTPLQAAAKYFHLECARVLMQRCSTDGESNGTPRQEIGRVHIDAVDPNGRTALHFGVGDALLTEILLEKRASVATRDNDGLTPLHWAATFGSAASITKLLEGGAQIQSDSTIENCGDVPSVIWLAAASGKEACVQVLIKHTAEGTAQLQVEYKVTQAQREKATIGKLQLSDMMCASSLTPLFVAILTGQQSLVEFMLACGIDVNFGAEQDNTTALMVAALGGQFSIAKLLLDRGANPNATNSAGKSVMSFAAQTGDFRMVEALHQQQGDPNPQVGEDADVYADCSPLHNAAKGGHLQVLKQLFGIGARDPGVHDGNWTLLHSAAQSSSMETVMYLMDEQGYEPLIPKMGYTGYLNPLHVSARIGSLELCEFFGKAGLGWNTVDNQGFSPLVLAVKSKNLNLVRVLLSNGVDVNSANDLGETAMHVVAENGDDGLIMAELLLQRGGDPTQQDKRGASMLHIACMRNAYETVRTLIRIPRLDCDMRDEKGNTPLFYAAEVGNLKLIELLLTRNVIVETRNESGETPFVAATANGFVDIMKLLLRCNAEADTSDNKGQRALHKAARNGHEEAAQLLLEHYVTLDAVDEKGNTALHSAALGRHQALVKLLLAAGLQPSANNNGTEPMHTAALSGDSEMMELLRSVQPMAVGERRQTLLHAAAAGGNTAIVAELLKDERNRADLSVVNKQGDLALHCAARSGSSECVTDLLVAAQAAAAGTAAARADTALHVAAEEGHIRLVKMLIEDHKAASDHPDSKGYTPMMRAVVNNKVEVCEYLMSVARSGMSSAATKNPFEAAIQGGNVAVFDYLVSHFGKAKAIECDATGWSPIHAAALLGNTEILDRLYRLGVDLTTPDRSSGKPAIMIAAEAGHLDFVKALVKEGVSLDTVDTHGDNILIGACRARQCSMVEYLLFLPAGLSLINKKGKDGAIALHALCSEQQLFSRGKTKEDVDANDKNIDNDDDDDDKEANGSTAVYTPQMEIAERMMSLQQGKVALNQRDDRGWAAVHCAADAGFDDVVAFLIQQQDCDVSGFKPKTGHRQPSALKLARKKEHEKCVLQLLQVTCPSYEHSSDAAYKEALEWWIDNEAAKDYNGEDAFEVKEFIKPCRHALVSTIDLLQVLARGEQQFHTTRIEEATEMVTGLLDAAKTPADACQLLVYPVNPKLYVSAAVFGAIDAEIREIVAHRFTVVAIEQMWFTLPHFLRFMNPEQDYAVIIEADEEKQHGDVCSAIETSKHSQSARWLEKPIMHPLFVRAQGDSLQALVALPFLTLLSVLMMFVQVPYIVVCNIFMEESAFRARFELRPIGKCYFKMICRVSMFAIFYVLVMIDALDSANVRHVDSPSWQVVAVLMYGWGLAEALEIVWVTVKYAHANGVRNAVKDYLLTERLTDTVFSSLFIAAFVCEFVEEHPNPTNCPGNDGASGHYRRNLIHHGSKSGGSLPPAEHHEAGCDKPVAADMLLAAAVILLNVRMLSVTATHHRLGPLLLMVKKCLQDVMLFSYLLFTCGLCFVIGYTFVLRRAQLPDDDARTEGSYALENFGARVWTMLWTINGEETQVYPKLPGAEFMQVMGWVYIFYVIVVLMNLLIAMMGDTYSAVKESSEFEWRLQRAKKLVATSHAEILPPPADLLLNFVRFWRYIFCGMPCCQPLKTADHAAGAQQPSHKGEDEQKEPSKLDRQASTGRALDRQASTGAISQEQKKTEKTGRERRYTQLTERVSRTYFREIEEQDHGLEAKLEILIEEVAKLKRF